MLIFENVTRDFMLDTNTVITPVKNVSLRIDRGDFIIITGRSGTGKTTLLNLAAGLVKPTSGKVKIENKDLGAMTDKQVSALRSQKIGFVFQFPSLLPSLSVIENISLPAIFTRRKQAAARAMMLLEMVGLADKKNVYPRQLSAGEQKRVVMVRALINEPQLILADEPSSDLDEKTEIEIMSIFRDLNIQGTTILIVSHNLQLIDYATRALRMENGILNEITLEKK
jgi:ABC-type lipoprotein export system ATPase subunit